MATGKFEIGPSADGGVKFTLKAANGQVILTSETYTTVSACKKGIESVAESSYMAAVEDQTVEGFEKEANPKFEIFTDKAGEYRFRLKAANGQIVGVSEGYTTIQSCKTGIESVYVNALEAAILEAFE